MEKNSFEELKIFLRGTFHQDIEDPDEELKYYIQNVGNDWLKRISNVIEEFLISEISNYEKNQFIKDNTEIYFPEMGILPLNWLNGVLGEMRKSIKVDN